jgi:dTDP-glucose 4,6-dehydratase/UDP-glucose 4-epimerase
MKLLIVGSKGFIGSHCFNYFEKKHEVWGCDIMLDYTSSNYSIIGSPESDFNELFKANHFDICINCSGAANVKYSFTNPIDDYKLNALNVMYILEAIRVNSPDCKFINLSSAAVYGNPELIPIKPNTAKSPISPYGYHKSIAELICEEYNKLWQIPTCSLRIFSTYGPGLQKQLFWDLYQKTKQGHVELWGTGNETRDFIYITDLVNTINLTINNCSFEGDIINIANGEQITIAQVAKIFANIVGLSSDKITFKGQERTGDPLNWEADISTIKSWGYKAEIDIHQGIKNYILWAQIEQK